MSGFFLYTEVLLSSIIDRKATEGNQEGGSVMSNTLQKFDGLAQDYAVGRPVYSEKFVEALFRDCGFSSDSIVADIGSGTGKFAGQLLERGCTVYGVEPNDDMREKSVEELSGFVWFYPVKGTEAVTSLKDHSIDFVTTAQAFHWFDVIAFAKECRRILKPGGKVFLIWNMRDMSDQLNQEAYEVYRNFCPDFKGYGGGVQKDDERIRTFFDDRYQYIEFTNPLYYSKETFISRSLSGSYSLKEGDARYPEYLKALRNLFEKYQKDGILTMGNDTAVYFGAL